MREEWLEVNLGDACFTTSGGTPSRKVVDYYKGNIPWVKSGELNFNVIRDTEEHISARAIENSSAKLFPAGTLLIALYGATIGKLAILDVPAATNQAICGIFQNELFIKGYLYYYLLLQRQNLIKQGAGGAQPNISQTILKKLPIQVAPIPEQRAIVARIEQLLSELDNGVGNLNKAKGKLEIYRQAVLKKAFEGELTNTNKIDWTTLGEVCFDVEYGTSSKSDNEGLIPVLRMGNIQSGQINWEDLKFTSDSEEIKKYRLNKDDVLFNRTNSPDHVGKTAIFKGEREAIFAGYLIRIKYDKEIVNGQYLNYFLNCHIAKKYGNKVKSFGVNQSNINGTKLKSYPFPKVPLDEQSKIVQEIETRLSVCDNILANIDESLSKAEALRHSILKKAFEGKLLSEEELDACRSNPDWEPANKLFERIKRKRNERF